MKKIADITLNELNQVCKRNYPNCNKCPFDKVCRVSPIDRVQKFNEDIDIENVGSRIKLNLTTTTDEEERILEYLEINASESLREKINKKAERPMIPCLVYCYDEAQKLYQEAKKQNKCVAVDGKLICGWAVHYYEDVEEQQDIEKAKKVLEKLKAQENAKSEPKLIKAEKPIETPKKPTKPSAEKLIKAYKQLSLLDMLEE